MPMKPLPFLAISGWLCLVAAPAGAVSLTVNGITFTDELGGFRLIDVRGSGRQDDPFVVTEEITGEGPAILSIYGLDQGLGDEAASRHSLSFWMTKVAINKTDRPWLEYQIELRETEESTSPYLDGLSFAQAWEGRVIVSDKFGYVEPIDEPFDSVLFRDGLVPADAAVSFSFVVTDESPRARILLIQQALDPVSDGRGLGARAEPVALKRSPH